MALETYKATHGLLVPITLPHVRCLAEGFGDYGQEKASWVR